MLKYFTRRQFVAAAATSTAAVPLMDLQSVVAAESPRQPFRYCLNSGTIAGHKLPLEKQIELVTAAGYEGIEPWVRDIQTYAQSGSSLSDLRKLIDDSGLTVESAIGFTHWIADDDAERKHGLEQAKRDMDLVRQIGGERIAAPPAGANKSVHVDLLEIAERYRALLDAGAQIGVVPQVEVWGPAAILSRLGEALYVAVESGHPNACLLLDVYHLYKGGSPFEGLKMIAGTSMHCFHMNDYPADPPRETIGDADRVYPGDGIAPLDSILQTLSAIGFSGTLSLELFNRDYWAQDVTKVLRTGLRKMKEAVARALE